MPIKINLHNNTSHARVNPKDTSDDVKVKSGPDIQNKVLESQIKEEIVNRQKADQNLQLQLDEKVDRDEFEDHINNTTIHVTAEEKADWNNKEKASVEQDPESDDLILVFNK